MGDRVLDLTVAALDATVTPAAASFSSGLASAGSVFFNTLDQWARVLEKHTGGMIDRGGIFEKVARDLGATAAEYAEQGFKRSDGKIAAVGHHLYAGVGKAAFNLPMIAAMKLPTFSAMTAGAEAAQAGENVTWGTAVGLAQGLLLQGVLKATGFFRLPDRIAASGLIFGGTSLYEEMQKPADQRDYEKVVADFLIGAGLASKQPGGRTRAQLLEDVKKAYGPQIKEVAQRWRAEPQKLERGAKQSVDAANRMALYGEALAHADVLAETVKRYRAVAADEGHRGATDARRNLVAAADQMVGLAKQLYDGETNEPLPKALQTRLSSVLDDLDDLLPNLPTEDLIPPGKAAMWLTSLLQHRSRDRTNETAIDKLARACFRGWVNEPNPVYRHMATTRKVVYDQAFAYAEVLADAMNRYRAVAPGEGRLGGSAARRDLEAAADEMVGLATKLCEGGNDRPLPGALQTALSNVLNELDALLPSIPTDDREPPGHAAMWLRFLLQNRSGERPDEEWVRNLARASFRHLVSNPRGVENYMAELSSGALAPMSVASDPAGAVCGGSSRPLTGSGATDPPTPGDGHGGASPGPGKTEE